VTLQKCQAGDKFGPSFSMYIAPLRVSRRRGLFSQTGGPLEFDGSVIHLCTLGSVAERLAKYAIRICWTIFEKILGSCDLAGIISASLWTVTTTLLELSVLSSFRTQVAVTAVKGFVELIFAIIGAIGALWDGHGEISLAGFGTIESESGLQEISRLAILGDSDV
jgi:hypothetical protein